MNLLLISCCSIVLRSQLINLEPFKYIKRIVNKQLRAGNYSFNCRYVQLSVYPGNTSAAMRINEFSLKRLFNTCFLICLFGVFRCKAVLFVCVCKAQRHLVYCNELIY